MKYEDVLKSLEQYLKDKGYSDYEIEMTLLYFEYGFKMPEDIHKDVMKWIYSH